MRRNRPAPVVTPFDEVAILRWAISENRARLQDRSLTAESHLVAKRAIEEYERRIEKLTGGGE